MTNDLEQTIEDLLDKIYKMGIRHGVKGYKYLNKDNATLVKGKTTLLKAIQGYADEEVLRALYTIPMPSPAKKTKLSRNGSVIPNSFNTNRSDDYIEGYVAGSHKAFYDAQNAIKKRIALTREREQDNE